MIIPLHHLRPGQSACVVELRSRNAARLDRLSAFGLVPGSQVCMRQVRPAFIFSVGELDVSVDQEVAGEIFVRPA